MIPRVEPSPEDALLAADGPADREPFAGEEFPQQAISNQKGARPVGVCSGVERRELARNIKVVGTVAAPSKPEASHQVARRQSERVGLVNRSIKAAGFAQVLKGGRVYFHGTAVIGLRPSLVAVIGPLKVARCWRPAVLA
jgi:hypothetical protein